MAVDLVKTVIRLEFSEALRPWLEVRDLFRVASDDDKVELQGEATYAEREQIKQRVGFHVRALTFEQEGRATSDATQNNALRTFSDLNAVSHLPDIQRVRLDSAYIEPNDLPFAELRSLMRKAYLQPTPVSELATDIGVTLEKDEGHIVKHVRLGPMEPNQLQESYLHYPNECIPQQFVFIGLGYQWKVEMEFNTQELSDVLDDARAWQESTIQLVLADISNVAGE